MSKTAIERFQEEADKIYPYEVKRYQTSSGIEYFSDESAILHDKICIIWALDLNPTEREELLYHVIAGTE